MRHFEKYVKHHKYKQQTVVASDNVSNSPFLFRMKILSIFCTLMALSGRVRLFLAQMIPKWATNVFPKKLVKGIAYEKHFQIMKWLKRKKREMTKANSNIEIISVPKSRQHYKQKFIWNKTGLNEHQLLTKEMLKIQLTYTSTANTRQMRHQSRIF